MDINLITTQEKRGPATFVTCNYCHRPLAMNRAWTAGAGHTEDCDAILAGITIDAKRLDDEESAHWLNGMDEAQRFVTLRLLDMIKEDCSRKVREWLFDKKSCKTSNRAI